MRGAEPYLRRFLPRGHILCLDTLLAQEHHPVMVNDQGHTRVSGEVVRALTSADLALLEPPKKPPGIKKLRESHHALARLVAEGRSLQEIWEEHGYSISRSSILKWAAAFAGLVGFYHRNLQKMRGGLVLDHLKSAVMRR